MCAYVIPAASHHVCFWALEITDASSLHLLDEATQGTSVFLLLQKQHRVVERLWFQQWPLCILNTLGGF